VIFIKKIEKITSSLFILS